MLHVIGAIMAVASMIIHLLYLKITWLILSIIIVCWVFSLAWLKYKNSRKFLLTLRLKQELKSSFKQDNPIAAGGWFHELYLPSLKSVSLIAGSIFASFLLAHLPGIRGINFYLLEFTNSNHYQNLIAIHAGTGAIIFALLIFIAESLRDDETKDRARVLLKESFLFPLTVAEVLVFFIFIWGNVNFFAVIPVMLVAGATIASLWRLLSVLLSRSRFSHKRLELLKDRLKQSINLAASERIGNKILLESLGEGRIELKFYPLSFDLSDKESLHCFYADKVGVVTDIRLNKLDEFAKIVEKESNKNGFSFYKEKARQINRADAINETSSESPADKFQQADRQFLNKKFRDIIDTESQLLICVEKNSVKNQEVLKKLSKLAKEAFIIKDQENFSEEIKLEIDGLKDQFISAINERKSGKIDELIKTYTALAESFLDLLKSYGGGYTYEQARKEHGEIFGGWNEIRWLSDSIREIYVQATQSHDEEIIRDVAYLPVAIAIRAIKYGDQFLYQEFLKFPSYLYFLSRKESDSNVKEFMVDRSWRHLKEMSDFFIEYQLKRKANDSESIKKYKDFTIPIFFAFQNLLKAAFDKRDIIGFQEFLSKFSELYSDFDPERDYPNAASLRLSLDWVNEHEEKIAAQDRIKLFEEREEAARDIHLKKRQVFFGLAAWIFEQYRRDPTSTEVGGFYKQISTYLPQDLKDLTTLYSSCRTFEMESFWRWDDWEIIPDAGVQSIDFHSKLDYLFCLKALQILSRHDDQDLKLPHSRDLAFLAEDRKDTKTLVGILDDISSRSETWKFILTLEQQAKIPRLKELLVGAKKIQELSEEEFIKTAPIDPDKLLEFKKELKKGFESAGILRTVAIRTNSYQDLSSQESKTDVLSYGYNQIDNKAAFVKKWYVHYGGWGEQYGSGMAKSEDQTVFEEMLNGVAARSDIIKQDVIPQVLEVIKKNRFKNPIILQTPEYLFEYEQIKESDLFVSQHNRDCPKTVLSGATGYMGVLKLQDQSVPVIDIFVNKKELKNKIIVADLHEFGTWKQYSPIDKPEDSSYQDGIFFLQVTDLNQDDQSRKKLVDQNPSWLQKYDEKEGYLRTKVLIKFFEKFRFEVSDTNAGHVFNVTDGPATIDEEE